MKPAQEKQSLVRRFVDFVTPPGPEITEEMKSQEQQQTAAAEVPATAASNLLPPVSQFHF